MEYKPQEIIRAEYISETIYLDKSFTKEEVDIVLEATWEWAKATDNRVIYKVIQLSEKENEISINNSILFNKVNADNIDILSLDYLHHNYTLGYYSNNNVIPNIVIVAERLDSERLYKEVVLHELGHSLGLEHDHEASGIGTLMYPSVDKQSESITPTDVFNYCKIHHCLKN